MLYLYCFSFALQTQGFSRVFLTSKHRNIETSKHRNIETSKHRNIETSKHRNIETSKRRNVEATLTYIEVARKTFTQHHQGQSNMTIGAFYSPLKSNKSVY